MVRTTVLENFPGEMLTYRDVETILDQVDGEYGAEGRKAKRLGNWSRPAGRAWPALQKAVRAALLDAILRGPAASAPRVARVNRMFARIALRYPGDARELQICYLTYLDSIYGAILRHTLCRAGTALCTPQGSFSLYSLSMFRYARVRYTSTPPLQQLMELLSEGGPRLELTFAWRPLGDGAH